VTALRTDYLNRQLKENSTLYLTIKADPTNFLTLVRQIIHNILS